MRMRQARVLQQRSERESEREEGDMIQMHRGVRARGAFRVIE